MMTVQERDLDSDDRSGSEIEPLTTFDFAEHLYSPAMLAAYLSEAFADGDPTLIASALGDACKAYGMPDIAARSGLARESLYKALRPGSQPRLETILRVLKALDLQLVVQPISNVRSAEDSGG
jgi:probable addiction module antidote protein